MSHGAASIVLFCALLLAPSAHAQLFRKSLPVRSVGGQFAGSVGLFSINAMQHTRTERIGIGFGAGHVPHDQGGPLNTFSLRFMYTPWKLEITPRWQLEPLQTGVFVAYSTGLDLTATWPSYLERGYYWWFPNFRQHLYARSQLSYKLKGGKVQRVAAYLEVNTNDLYVYSWWPNRGSIRVYDILFFGAGVQVYLRPMEPRAARHDLSGPC